MFAENPRGRLAWVDPADALRGDRLSPVPGHNFSAVGLSSDIEDSQDYRINSETGIVAPASAHIVIKFSYVVGFANEPPLNAAGTRLLQKTDRIL